MKELSIEGKAKAYDEALERARNLHKDAIDMGESLRAKQCEIIFPELKESDDEKIRKTLIHFFSNGAKNGAQTNGIYDKDIIAWLEKQGGITKLSEEEQNRFAKGVLTSCALSFINYLDAHKYHGKMCVSNGECEDIENAFHNAMWDRLHRYYCKYIEKQGEHKPADKVKPFDKYEGLTDFERTLTDICIGWIGEEIGWKQYIKDNADALLEIAAKKFSSVQDAPF